MRRRRPIVEGGGGVDFFIRVHVSVWSRGYTAHTVYLQTYIETKKRQKEKIISQMCASAKERIARERKRDTKTTRSDNLSKGGWLHVGLSISSRLWDEKGRKYTTRNVNAGIRWETPESVVFLFFSNCRIRLVCFPPLPLLPVRSEALKSLQG